MSQPLATSTLPAESSGTAPTVRRRLAALLYEAVILFGVVFIAGYLFSTLTQQRNGLTHHNLLAGWIGLVVGAYFVWFWTHGGQTLPMKTWRLKLVRLDGTAVGTREAVVRYLGAMASALLLGLGFVWAIFDREGQFLHDRVAGTRIVRI